MNNKQLGSRFEEYVANYLANHGYWTHLLKQNSNGQPADLIVVKNSIADLIDCKTCGGRGLALSRIEDNQEYAMKKWKECGNGNGYFACLVDNEVWFLPYYVVEYHMSVLQHSYISTTSIKEEGILMEDWI